MSDAPTTPTAPDEPPSSLRCLQCTRTLRYEQRDFCSPECRTSYRAANPGPVEPFGLASLSPREREVFVLFLQGYRWTDIAERMGISPKTVESHKVGLMRKLRADTSVELVKIGIREGITPP